MPSLNVIINGNSDPFKKELLAVERLARSTGSNISRGLSGEGGHGAKAGVVTEVLVLMRELSRGNLTRVPGSITILAQRMGLLKYIMKDTTAAANVLADAWEMQAEKAGLAAMASTRKASASMAALYADGGETEATLNAAMADEEKAAADIAVAQTTRAKATASAEAAAAANLEAAGATASIGPMGIVIGVIAAIAVGAYVASKLVRKLTDDLSGVKAPEDFKPEYILKRNQKGNAAAEGQREINLEISKSVSLYYSAAEAAKRSESVTKTHFDHLRKMNEYQEQAEMNRATSEGARAAIRKKYSDKDLEVSRQERDAQIRDKRSEQSNLEHESAEKKRKADAIAVPAAAQDENDIKLAEAKLKIMDDAASAIQKGKDDPGFLNLVNGRDAIRAYNSVSDSGVSTKDLDTAEKQVALDRAKQIQEVKRLKEQKDANDLKRKERDDLTGAAGKSAAQAATIKEALPAMVTAAATANSDAATEAASKLAAEAKIHHNPSGNGPTQSQWERAGGLINGISMVDVSKEQLQELKLIRAALTARGQFASKGVRY